MKLIRSIKLQQDNKETASEAKLKWQKTKPSSSKQTLVWCQLFRKPSTLARWGLGFREKGWSPPKNLQNVYISFCMCV